MKLGDITIVVREYFKAEPKETLPVPVKGDAALSKSTMYSGTTWPQYNPDDLMTRLGYNIYRRMMRDDQVKVVVKFRRNAVTGRRWSFELDTEDLPEEEVKSRIALCEEIVRRMKGTFKKKLDGIMTSMQFGFSMSEKTYELFDHEGKSYYGIKNIRLKPFNTFYFYTDKYGNLLRLMQQIDGEELPNLDIDKFIHHTHNNEDDEYYGSSELREAYRDWFSKDMAHRHHNIWLERCAAGLLILKPEGERVVQAGSTEYYALLDMMTNVKTSTSFLLPTGITAEIISFEDTEAYERAFNRFDKSISKSLLMPNMLGFSGDNKNGSRALGDTQLEAFLWMLDSEADDLEETVNEQLFAQLGDLNWGDGIYPQFKLAPLSDKQKFAVVEAWGNLIQKGAAQRSDSDEEHLRNLLEMPEKDMDSVAKPIEPDDGNDDNKDGDSNSGNSDTGNDGDNNGNGDKNKPGDEFDKNKPDETIIGKGVLKAGFERAVKRVNFVAIDGSANIVTFTAVDEVSEALGKGILELTDNIDLNNIENELDKIRKINFKASVYTDIRRAFFNMLKEGWKIGKVNGNQELRKALGKDEALLSRFKFERLEDKAAKYFKADSFRMTGDLTGRALSIIRNELLNGVKYSKTQAQIKKTIFERLASEGMLDEDIMLQALGEALGTPNPTHRIENVVRTNTFAAINEARFSMFTDPELNGFVEALQYSAILDSRVTQICRELDDKIYPLTSENWEKYRPPNHNMCRSLLTVITTRDIWQTSPDPTIDPQKGFE